MGKAVWCRTLGFAVIAVTLVVASPATPADHPTGAKSAPAATAPPPVDELGRGTPQSALRGFLDAAALHNYRRAASYLDLRRISAADVAARGPELAHQLRIECERRIAAERHPARDISTTTLEPATSRAERQPERTLSAHSCRRPENCGVAVPTSTTASAGTFARWAAATIASADGDS